MSDRTPLSGTRINRRRHWPSVRQTANPKYRSNLGTSQEPLGRPFFETGLGSVKKGWYFDACEEPRPFDELLTLRQAKLGRGG